MRISLGSPAQIGLTESASFSNKAPKAASSFGEDQDHAGFP